MKKHGEYAVYSDVIHEEVAYKGRISNECMAEQDGEFESPCSLGTIAFFMIYYPI